MVEKLEKLQENARQLIRTALKPYPPLPQSYREKLTLLVRFEENQRIFELYVDSEQPEDAIVIARAVLDGDTGLGKAEVFPENWSS